MADEKPEQEKPAEESKKDTVRINLPPGLTSRGAAPAGPAAPPGAKIVPRGPSASPEEEAKKETAILGRPAEVPQPKQETSRVQVVAAKPSPPGLRPAVKLRRDEPSPAPASGAPAAPAAAPVRAAATAAAPSMVDLGLSVVAMVLSLVVVGYLAWLAFG